MSEQAIIDAVRRRVGPKKRHVHQAQRITSSTGWASGATALCRCGKDVARYKKVVGK